jgi:very-short-patch-repair endonuclease
VRRQRHYRGGYDSAGLKNLAREQRKDPTEAESLLWQLLRRRQLLGFKFRRQHQFGDYVSDFYCSEAQLVIECDGSIHQKNERWRHDQIRDAYMTSQGVRVLRFTNEQVLGDVAAVLREIAEHLPEKRKD